MGMQINTNMAANNAYRSLSNTQNDLSKSLEKLSSGLRINRAGDDAAGLAISEGLKSQIGGLTVAARNAQDGIGAVQTAEGGLNQAHSILQRLRDLGCPGSATTRTTPNPAAPSRPKPTPGQGTGPHRRSPRTSTASSLLNGAAPSAQTSRSAPAVRPTTPIAVDLGDVATACRALFGAGRRPPTFAVDDTTNAAGARSPLSMLRSRQSPAQRRTGCQPRTVSSPRSRR